MDTPSYSNVLDAIQRVETKLDSSEYSKDVKGFLEEKLRINALEKETERLRTENEMQKIAREQSLTERVRMLESRPQQQYAPQIQQPQQVPIYIPFPLRFISFLFGFYSLIFSLTSSFALLCCNGSF